MYERHFGITGPPFHLSPDPAFYFDASQHRAALSALRSAIASERTITVLSGEIGAGKTTVLRAWLAEVEACAITAAQITNTQLAVDDLLVAIANAFGVSANPARHRTPAETLRWFLAGLHGKTVVLAIDEAQNLDRAALHCLVELTRAAKDAGTRLRIVLAGQPELRAHVADTALPALQAQIQRACHLEPLDASQTRQYIEHRLQHVGWTGTPSFAPGAFDEIHRITGGIPRRINLLANRLLLVQYLNDTAHVDAATVSDVAQALDAEIGSGTVTPVTPRRDPQHHAAGVTPGALLLLASGRSDYIKAMALMHAMGKRQDLPPARVVAVSDSAPWDLNHDIALRCGASERLLSLCDDQPDIDTIEARLAQLIERQRPSAVLVFDGGALAYRCALVARRDGTPLVHVGADAQSVDEQADPACARSAMAQLADLRFGCQPSEGPARETHRQQAHGVGSLSIDALRLAHRVAHREPPHALRPIANGAQLDARRGYGVVALRGPAADARAPCRAELLPFLRAVSRDLPLVWPMQHTAMRLARSCGLARTFEGDRIARIEELGYLNFVRLVGDATCVLTDSLDVMEEAAALRVPCLSLDLDHGRHVGAGHWLPALEVGHDAKKATRVIWQILFSAPRYAPLPAQWDGRAGTRIAAHLSAWLRQRAAQTAAAAGMHHTLPAASALGLNPST